MAAHSFYGDFVPSPVIEVSVVLRAKLDLLGLPCPVI